MGADRMDELFRSALGQKESEVSADSWSKLEMMMDHQPVEEKKGYFYFKSMAASLLLLVVAGLVYWFNQPAEEWSGYQHALEESITPKKIELNTTIQMQVSPKTLQAVHIASAPSIIENQEKASKELVPEKLILEETPQQILAEMNESTQFDETTTLAVETSEESEEVIPVKVTYKKTPAEEQVIDSKERKSLKQIIEQARGIDTMEMWADIREAKDKVLDDPFGLQKSQRQKLK